MLMWPLYITVAICVNVRGYADFQLLIPNGGRVPDPCNPKRTWDGVGHIKSKGAGIRNGFGTDFLLHDKTWSLMLCRADSDGDGKTNGEELGDPNCVWRPGEIPERTTSLSHPGICDPVNNTTCIHTNGRFKCGNSELDCDSLNKTGTKNITLRFPETTVPNKETSYYCMTFDLPSDDKYHIIATKPVIDNEAVLHHMLLFGCEEDTQHPPANTKPQSCGMVPSQQCDKLIALWTVGLPGECLHEQEGFPIGRHGFKKVAVQVHWNNPNLTGNLTDSSGLNIYYTSNLRQNDAAILTVGQEYIEIFPGSSQTITKGHCSPECSMRKFAGSVNITMVINHMHYLGKSQHVELYRSGKRHVDLANNRYFRYDDPVSYVFDEPITVMPGDEIRTTCVYNSNTGDTNVRFGPATSDEMCYAFIRYYPAKNIPIPWCVSFMDKPCYDDMVLSAYSGSACNESALFFSSDEEWRVMYNRLMNSCNMSNICQDECGSVVDEIRNHRCFQSDKVSDFIRPKLSTSRDDSILLSAVSACDGCTSSRCLCYDPDRCAVSNSNNIKVIQYHKLLMTVSLFVLYMESCV